MALMCQMLIISSIKASVIGIVILGIRKIVQGKISPVWYSLLWAVFVLKLLLPIAPESKLSAFNVFNHLTVQSIDRIKQSTEMLGGIVDSTETPKINIAKSLSGSSENKTIILQNTKESVDSNPENLRKVTNSEDTGINPNNLDNQDYTIRSSQIITFIWLVGMAIFAVWMWASKMIFYKRLKQAAQQSNPRVEQLLECSKKQMNISKNVKFIIQEAIKTPAVLGVFNPKILLTKEFLTLEDDQIKHILAHELSHYQRGDLLVNKLLNCLQVIYWFNPCIYYLFRSIREDIELAADTNVLHKLPSREHIAYGKTLITLLENSVVTTNNQSVLGMSKDKNNIVKRIDNIKNAEKLKRKKRIVMVLSILVILGLGIAFLTNPISEQTTLQKQQQIYLKELMDLKTPYVGDASKVINLLGQLQPFYNRKEVRLLTKTQPYGISVDYDEECVASLEELQRRELFEVAAMIFTLVGNVDTIEFNFLNWGGKNEPYTYTYTRRGVQTMFEKDFKEYGKDTNTLENLQEELAKRPLLYPENYTVEMKSSPGIRIQARQGKDVQKVSYETNSGTLKKGEEHNIISCGKEVDGDLGLMVYWSPRENDGNITTKPKTEITQILYDGSHQVVDKRIIPIFYNEGVYSVNDPSQKGVIQDHAQYIGTDTLKVYQQDTVGLKTWDEDLILVVNDSSDEAKLVKNILSKKQPIPKPKKVPKANYRINMMENNAVKEVELWMEPHYSKDNLIRYTDQSDVYYHLEEKDSEILQRLFRNHVKSTNKLERDLFEGYLMRVGASKDGIRQVDLKNYRGKSTIALKADAIEQSGMKKGDYVKIYTERLDQLYSNADIIGTIDPYRELEGVVTAFKKEGDHQIVTMEVTKGYQEGVPHNKFERMKIDEDTYFPNKLGREFKLGDRLKVSGMMDNGELICEKVEAIFDEQ